jgi:Rps23 Pro-64 3,4-dihydroxylase Tpa1-like proline 4-hydroxylase
MISSPLTDYLKLVQPYTSSALISSEAWSKINAVAEFLPSAITSFFGFECPLGIEEAKSDFLICADVAGTGRQVLGGENEVLPKCLMSDPVWNQVHQFSKEWNTETSSLNQKINNVWLEFDLDDSVKNFPIPSCFFGSEPIYSAKSPYANLSHINPYKWISQTALKLLLNANLPESVEAQLFNCLDLLPKEAYVFQLGLMLARNIKNLVRVCIRNISPEQIGEYLQQIGWSGSLDILQVFLKELSGFVERIDLDIDIGERIAPKIGLECYFSKQPKLEPRWQLFLDYLVNKNLCLPQKQAALLAYPGFLRESSVQKDWPSYLSKSSNLLENSSEAVFFRKLHHIKIVYQDNQPQLAKAYLAMGYRLMTPDFVHRWRQFNNCSVQIDGFLNQEEQCQLLEFVQKSQARFVPSELGIDNTELSIHRRSWVLEDFAEFEKLLNQKMAAILPDIFSKLGLNNFPIAHLETQLTAHNDGDYYRIHNDNGTTESGDRILTYVYYFYQEPKAFSGGELRIYETTLTNQIYYADSFQTIEPRNNSIVFFPSGYMHEVLTVNCPSQAFANSRFTINGWVWRNKQVSSI